MSNPFKDNPELLNTLRNMPFPKPDIPDIPLGPSRPTAEHAKRQIEQADEQLTVLAAMKSLWESQAAEAAANAHRESEQQKFNRAMTWVAIVLAGASVLVPFIILWIEQTLTG